MRKHIIKLLRYTGIPIVLRETIQKNMVTIITFHNPEADTFFLCVKYLKKQYNIISLDRYISSLENGEVLPVKSVVITLDDGHKDNYKLMKIIKEMEVPVTIFLCSEIAGTNRHFWWTHISSKEELRKLKRIPETERRRYYKKYDFDYLRDYEEGQRQSLNAEEIKEMLGCGLVDFQSHTRYHFILDMCIDSTAYDEISQSKITLEEKSGKEIYAIAFPNGIYTERDISFVKQAGYKCALTTEEGYNNKKTDLYKLRRLSVRDSSDIDEIVVRTSGLWGMLKKIRRAIYSKNID